MSLLPNGAAARALTSIVAEQEPSYGRDHGEQHHGKAPRGFALHVQEGHRLLHRRAVHGRSRDALKSTLPLLHIRRRQQ